MDSSNQIIVDVSTDTQKDPLSKTQPNNPLQWSAELGRFLRDMMQINAIVENDSIKDKLTLIEWLKKLKANAKALRLDSVKVRQLEQLLIKAGVVS